MVYGTLICSTIERYIIYNIKKKCDATPIARAPERPSARAPERYAINNNDHQ